MKSFYLVSAALLGLATQPSLAADKKPVDLPTITKCTVSFGSVAITDGDNQGWTALGLGSPRELLASIVGESGCFTMYDSASGVPATFLMSAVAGSKEEVDRTVGAVKSAAVEGLARSGMLGGFGGGGFKALGALGGLGGKKKTISVGLRVLSPANGQTVALGTAESSKTSITLGGAGGFGVANTIGGGASQYLNSKEGSQLAIAFITAYNNVSAQSGALASAPKPVVAAAAVPTTAVATSMFATPAKTAAVVRALRAGTALKPTGKKQGLFVEVEDSFGTTGWVSVEDMR
ncbi:MAG: hypothetical protein RL367_1686 [Pseudomonadota bacterium]